MTKKKYRHWIISDIPYSQLQKIKAGIIKFRLENGQKDWDITNDEMTEKMIFLYREILVKEGVISD